MLKGKKAQWKFSQDKFKIPTQHFKEIQSLNSGRKVYYK